MGNNVQSVMKKTAIAAGFVLCLATGGLFGGAIANATTSHDSNADVKVSTTPPQMELAASAGEQIRTTGTQGTFAGGDQCTSTSAVKVDCVISSSAAAPQYKVK